MIEILYFAWLRQKIGKNAETINLPSNVKNIKQLIGYLCGLAPEYHEAFQDLRVIKMACNQDYATLDSKVCDGDEIAFFPPVTGG